MKTYEQMAESVLRRRDEYFTKRKAVRSRIMTMSASLSMIAVVFAITLAVNIVLHHSGTGDIGLAGPPPQDGRPSGAGDIADESAGADTTAGITERPIGTDTETGTGDTKAGNDTTGAHGSGTGSDTGSADPPGAYLVKVRAETSKEAGELFGSELTECTDTTFTGFTVDFAVDEKSGARIPAAVTYEFDDGEIFIPSGKFTEGRLEALRYDERYTVIEYEDTVMHVGGVTDDGFDIWMTENHGGGERLFIAKGFAERERDDVLELLLSLRMPVYD